MSCKQKLFLETTIQIDRLFEKPTRRKLIYDELSEADCYTCTLVLREFKLKAILACISLLYIIEENDSDPDIITEISNHFTEKSMLLKIYAEVKREANLEKSFDKELALATVRSYIRHRLLLRFEEIISVPLADLTKCEVAHYKVQEFDGKFYLETHCERGRAQCNLPKIYQDNEDHLKRIKELVENQSTLNPKLNRQEKDEFKRINEVYSDVFDPGKEGWNTVKGQYNCDKLADLTILIESFDDSAVYTTDRIYECFYNRLCFPHKKTPKIQEYPRSSGRGKRIGLKAH